MNGNSRLDGPICLSSRNSPRADGFCDEHERTPHATNTRGSGGQMSARLAHDSTTSRLVALDDPKLFDRLRACIIEITPERATAMLTTLAFERQRTIAPKHVAYLLAVMQSGELTDLIIQEAEFPNGRRVLVDGYHRLTALVQFGLPLLAVVVTHVVNSEDELNERYAKIDRASSRKPVDMLKAFGVTQRAEMNSTLLSAVSAGVTIVANDFPRHSGSIGNKSLIQRTHAVEQWLPEAQTYANCIAGATNEVRGLLSRAPVIAVALATLRHQPGQAEVFWSRMAAEDGLLKDSPEARLLAWLRATRVARIGQAVYSRYVAGAWNAYYEGRTLKLLKVYDSNAPVHIAGTPYGREGVR